MRTVSALTELVDAACDDPLTAMMSAANREIRTHEREAADRRRRFTLRDVLRGMDRLVAELEEMNLVGEREVPGSFLLELQQLADVLPSGVSPPTPWPLKTNEVLDSLFRLEEQLLTNRRWVLH